MTGVAVNLYAQNEEELIWDDMNAEAQVIYAFIREAMDQAGYQLRVIDVEINEKKESSKISYRVTIRCNRSCSRCR